MTRRRPFIACAGSGDAQHAIWAEEYFGAFLRAHVPNLEMHIYGNGVHANGMKDRNGEPFGTWHERFIDWFRDLGFLQKPGVETQAAKDVPAYTAEAPHQPKSMSVADRCRSAGSPAVSRCRGQTDRARAAAAGAADLRS